MSTPIIGQSQITINQCEEFLHNINSNAPYLASIYKKYCDIYGIKLEIAWVQMCLETNFLRYSNTSITTLDMHNYAGLGALDGNGRRQALKFNTEDKGVECHIQHLFAYCSKNSLPQGQNLIDPRFKYVDRGCAINVEDLGNGKWASDKLYANKLLDLLDRLQNTKVTEKGYDILYINQTNLSFRGNKSYGNNPKSIVLHHAEASHCSVYDIHQWHLNNGWAGIGYHYFVRKDGSVWKGRPDNVIGSHVAGYNSNTLGICAEGSYMSETMPYVQKQAIVDLCKYLCNKYGINKIYGHREVGSSNCPGTNYPLNEIRNAVSKGGSNSSPSTSSSKPTAVVTASALNVRENKSTSSKILGVLQNGKSVEVYRIEGDWVHIYYPPHGGFISKQYVKLYNIPNSMVQKQQVIKKEEEKKMDIILYYGFADEYCAKALRDKLKLPMLSLEDFKKNPNLKKNVGKVYMVGGQEKPVENTVLISGSNREDTMIAVANYIKNLK